MNKLRVLVVDKEEGIRAGVSRVLSRFSVDLPFMEEMFEFIVFQAETGEKALKLLKKTDFDIVLFDNQLPEMSGFELLSFITNEKPDIVSVMITSYTSIDLAVTATKNGAFDFVAKPFTPDELRRAIENISKHIYLRKMTRKMQQSGKQVRFEFLSVLSHELKAPINAIEGYLDLMQKRQAGENIADYDTMISRSMKRLTGMRNLIMDLLDLTRIESGKKSRHISTVNVYDIAKTATHTMVPYAIQRDVFVSLHSEKDIEIQADPDEIEIIFNNLISNAVKYNIEGGKVDVTILMEEQYLKIIVTDTGIGMKKDDIAKLFNDFVRIKSTKTKNISGSGLGLSIVKKLTELYHGSVTVDSEPDKGSTFIVLLKPSVENID